MEIWIKTLFWIMKFWIKICIRLCIIRPWSLSSVNPPQESCHLNIDYCELCLVKKIFCFKTGVYIKHFGHLCFLPVGLKMTQYVKIGFFRVGRWLWYGLMHKIQITFLFLLSSSFFPGWILWLKVLKCLDVRLMEMLARVHHALEI